MTWFYTFVFFICSCKFQTREFYPLVATIEEVNAMNSVIKKAENLMEELDAYDELDESLMEWFLAKYNEQNND